MRRFAIIAMIVVGCGGAETAECPGGGVCPAGTACRLDHDVQVCVLASCGNGVLEAGEDCDDGNNESGDGCQAACRATVRPAKRGGVAIAYDPVRDRIVAFGGEGTGLLNDTWEWDQDGWIERSPAGALPPARRDAVMTYDTRRAVVLMFGGADPVGQALDDFWSWDGERWTQLTPTVPRPGPRSRASMTFDRARGVAVLFGGRDFNGAVDDATWEWIGDRWQQPLTTQAPAQRSGSAMTFDESRGETILVGGTNDRATWLWNGTRWAILGGAQTSNDYDNSAAAFDRTRDRVVRFGGQAVDPPSVYGPTQELIGTAWVEQASDLAPRPRAAFGMVYVDSIDEVVVFGGDGPWNGAPVHYDDLWSWNGSRWREHF